VGKSFGQWRAGDDPRHDRPDRMRDCPDDQGRGSVFSLLPAPMRARTRVGQACRPAVNVGWLAQVPVLVDDDALLKVSFIRGEDVEGFRNK
jgi:hypothetical protein